MFVTALMWLWLIMMCLLAIGFFTAAVFVVIILITSKERNRELVITFAAVCMISFAIGYGLVCAAMAIGRNLF